MIEREGGVISVSDVSGFDMDFLTHTHTLTHTVLLNDETELDEKRVGTHT